MAMKVALIHIPKTGMTSIESAWGATHLKSNYRHFKGEQVVTFGHIHPEPLNQIIDLDGYLTIAFVRNPYDRMVSLWKWFKDKRANKDQRIPHTMTFKKFVQRIHQYHAEGDLTPVGLYHVKGLNAVNPQVDWIYDSKGGKAVNFIGRFERLTEDYNNLCSLTGFDRPLPHKLKSNRTHYSKYYDEETKQLVSEIYAEDLKEFNYDF